jgi:transposase-like protein
MKTEPEIRRCTRCEFPNRVRVGTMLEHSKLPILTWVRAIFLATQDKRGVSALQLQRQLKIGSYRTAWRLLHKIREAMRQRDDGYTLSGIIEFDGADLGEQKDKGQKKVLVAVETKEWVDSKGRHKERAGFAKVQISRETKIFAQQFVDKHIEPGSMVNTDASRSLTSVENVDADHRVMDAQPKQLDAWLPWVQRWVELAKTWLRGTYHGVRSKYFELYLAEYNYRFNRRHDPDGMFHRALTACAIAKPMRLRTLSA